MLNKYRPHVYVLPEDGDDSDLANGFVLELDPAVRGSKIQILDEAGGWRSVLELFASDHAPEMQRRPERLMVLLIDFDGDAQRLNYVKGKIPPLLQDRVFILGAWGEPEDLKRELGLSYEAIGRRLAGECRENTIRTWGHTLLQHNTSELDRLRTHVRPILFP